MKIVTIVGARPQFIKASAFSRAVKSFAGVEEVIVHTGQHFDKNMSDIFFEEMEIPTPKSAISAKSTVKAFAIKTSNAVLTAAAAECGAIAAEAVRVDGRVWAVHAVSTPKPPDLFQLL